MSQAKLARLVNISTTQIQQYESGRVQMPVYRLRACLAVLGWTIKSAPLPEDE